MVIVRLKGGVGNQLFQFACGRAIAAHRGEELFLDLIYLTVNPLNFMPRDFKLERLDNFKIADDNTLKSFNSLYLQGNAAFVTEEFPKHSLLSLLNNKTIEAVLLDGYFQDEFYFFGCGDLIRKEFKVLLDHYPDDSLCSLRDSDQNTVSIHLRRGDYLSPENLKALGICEPGYYQEAISIIESLVPDPHFYIFSDDPDQADRLFYKLLKYKTNVSAIINHKDPEHKDLVELSLMTQCKHFILANSSYSWWGSYLSDSPAKRIIAPRKWFNDESLSQLSEDIALETWVRI